ncbi:hypothetical protein LXL04_007055 [Taraxacum kok-saghyz]
MFSTVKPRVEGFMVEHRLAWIQIIGLSCCAWNEKAYSHVALQYDDVFFLEDEVSCVKINDKSYMVNVRELSNWEPEMEDIDASMDHDISSLSGESDNDASSFDNNDDDGVRNHN